MGEKLDEDILFLDKSALEISILIWEVSLLLR